MKRIINNKGQISYSKTVEAIVKNYMAENDSIYSLLYESLIFKLLFE